MPSPRQILKKTKKILIRILKIPLIKISGNNFVQGLLKKNILLSQELMGIGSGSEIVSSGEEGIFNALQQKIEPPYCIFDVGANKGQFLRLSLENIKTGDFSVHCFEPGYETFKFLVKSAGEDKRIRLNNVGLGKERGAATLHYDVAGSGLASLTKRNLYHFNIDFEKSENVEINTIDDYCAENGIKHIHLLKMDVEGHELDVLFGAKKMFANKAVDIVTFEFGGCNIDTRTYLRDFWYFFNERNFKIFRITPSGYLYCLSSYAEPLEQFNTVNFVAIAQ